MDSINEKLDWNEVKQYGKGIVIGVMLGLIMNPFQLRDKIYRGYVIHQVSNHLQTLDNFEMNELLSTAIKTVVSKVELSDNIENKEEIINRIKNAKYKFYEEGNFFHNEMDSYMSYFYDTSGDIDYIMVTPDIEQKHELFSYIHELNHLVDRHTIQCKEIIPNDLLHEPDLKMFYDFYENWPLIKSEGDEYNLGLVLYSINFDTTSHDDMNTKKIKEIKDYL